ncbi:hypothetical protein H5T55_00125 [Candidatus Bipolaricaulota bacterium]|nr:hypothetical protein [Candidatus Bipolaricaulota bacterium]
MRWREFSLAVFVVALVGAVEPAQGSVSDDPARFTLAVTDDAGRFFAGRTDDEGKFTCTVNFANILKVTGSLSDPLGEIGAVSLKLLFESRPEILAILGIGNVGALWVSADGFDWERVPRYTIDWTGSGVSIDLGSVVVTPKVSIRCQDITQGIKLYGETGEYVHFVTGTCTAELWYEFDPIAGLRLANKVPELPREVPRACRWVVVEKVEPGQVTQTYYHSDGKVWVEKERVVFKRVPSLPPSAQHCEHFLVKGAGGKEYMYHWWQPDPSVPGRWRSLGEWKPVETKVEEPIEEKPELPGFG